MANAVFEMSAFQHSNWYISYGRISPRDLQQQVNLLKISTDKDVICQFVNMTNLAWSVTDFNYFHDILVVLRRN